MVQWGPIEETDELNVIVSTMVAQFPGRNLHVPCVSTMRITEPTPSAFRESVRAFLRGHENLQTVYLSAHGLQTGLSFERNARPISPRQIGETIRLGTLHRSGVSLVLGCCYAFDRLNTLRNEMPSSISWLYGFEAAPRASDVANLMVAVLADDQRLFNNLATVGVNPGPDFAANYRRGLEAVLNAHHGAPADLVQPGGAGVAVGEYHQEARRWTGRLIRL
jgi:hypothetical protein